MIPGAIVILVPRGVSPRLEWGQARALSSRAVAAVSRFPSRGSHLCVVGLFFGTAIVMYMTPKSRHPEEQQKILSLFYSLFNPMLNPLIYSLRNKEVKGAFRRVLWKERLM